MSKKIQAGERPRVCRYFYAPYEQAMERVEREREQMFETVRRAWCGASVEETARRIGATAVASEIGMTFDEVLFFLYEQICQHGSGAVAEWMTKVPIICANN